MPPKPAHLSEARARAFQGYSVAAAYPHRAPYPAETFIILNDLISDSPRAVLDVGCGTGDIARNLVAMVERVDAIDFSAALVELGRTLVNGNFPNLYWHIGRIEDAPLHPPYALITAGESLHWMDWDLVLPRCAAAITPRAYLAILTRNPLPPPWGEKLAQIIPRYSTNPDYQPVDLIAELESRGLFQKVGEAITAPLPFSQSVGDYIESFHLLAVMISPPLI